MNGLGIKKASKNDKDTDILTPDEVALLRTHASNGTLTAEERELYSKHLDAMEKLIPEGKKKGKPLFIVETSGSKPEYLVQVKRLLPVAYKRKFFNPTLAIRFLGNVYPKVTLLSFK